MEPPSVDNWVLDKARQIKFNIRAYRNLSQAEAVSAVRYFLAQKGRKKKLKPGTEITIMSLIGVNE